MNYIFWWDPEFGDVEQTNYQHLHPATLLLQRKHTKVVLSREMGNRRRRKIFIPPPSTSENKWYSQKSWCNVNVLKFGITMLNLKSSFWHSGQSSFGVWIGYADVEKKSRTQQIAYHRTIFAGFTKPTMYRWHWDDGKDNAVIINKSNGTWGQTNLTTELIDIPYYKYFYGRYPKGKLNTTYGGDSGHISNPDILGIYWWADLAIVIDKKNVCDRGVPSPEYLNNPFRCWIFLSPISGADMPLTESNDASGGTFAGRKLPTTISVGNIMNSIVTTSPFVPHGLDTQPANFVLPVNIPVFYASRWQWGGAPWSPSDATNPCPPPSMRTDLSGVSISDPATVSISNLHPWDLDKKGVITRDGLSRILRELFITGTHGKLPSQKETTYSQDKEGGDSPERDSSSSSGDSETSGETTETEAEETRHPAPNPAVARRLQRLEQLFQRDRNFRRRLKKILKNC
nr:ORF1 [Torque teno arctocephalus australis virus 6]